MKRIIISGVAIIVFLTMFTVLNINQTNAQDCELDSICNSKLSLENDSLIVEFDILSSETFILPVLPEATIDFNYRMLRYPTINQDVGFSLNRIVIKNTPRRVKYSLNFSNYDFQEYLNSIEDFRVANFSNIEYENIIENNPDVCTENIEHSSKESWTLSEGCPIKEVLSIGDPVTVDGVLYVSYEVEIDSSEYYEINPQMIFDNLGALEIFDFRFEAFNNELIGTWNS